MRSDTLLFAQKSFSEKPALCSFLETAWVENAFKLHEEKIPYLAWILSSQHPTWVTITERLEKCIEKLELIAFSEKQVAKMKRELTSVNEKNFIGTFSELDTMTYFTERGYKVEYEPQINGFSKVPDFAVHLDKRPIIFEVSSLQAGNESEKLDKCWREIRRQVEKVPSKFLVSFTISPDIKPKDIQPIVNFIKQLLRSDKEIELKSPINGIEEITLKRIGKGTTVGMMWAQTDKKNKRLRELLKRELNQLSDKTPNIVAVNLFHYGGEIDFSNAVLGDDQYVMLLDKKTGRTVNEYWTRDTKERILRPQKNRRMTATIDYKYIFSPKNILRHPNPYLKFTEKEIQALRP